ncbi:MAG: hypothetical protein HYZ54_02595 [Ignavibacteriae bacterium]|nr:hypothetical protein [Ignavibacteriota bacterium]
MKFLILFVCLMVVTSLSAISQTREQAPFGGKLIDHQTTYTFERTDGSRITTFNDEGVFYLTRKATGDKQSPLPSFVKETKPQMTTYLNSKGQTLFTYDNKNWSKKPENLQGSTNIQEETPTVSPLFSYTKFPTMPITGLFHIEFMVKQEAEISFLITSATGETIVSEVKKFTSGGKNYDFDFKNFANGVYYLQLTVNGVKLPAKMISKVD